MSETDPTEASDLLERLRAEHAELLREGRALAELVGMSQSHLEKLLSGEKKPAAASLKKIAAYFAHQGELHSELNAGPDPDATGRLTPVVPAPLSGFGGSTIRVVELGAVEQRQYIAAMLEASGIPKGIASYVGLHVALDGSPSPAAGLRAAQAMANTLLAEEAEE